MITGFRTVAGPAGFRRFFDFLGFSPLSLFSLLVALPTLRASAARVPPLTGSRGT
ncbi:MAG: hypothetical protein JWL83_420 [Actinomycetia bacterium]|nr:hypothetical protein [Actinomycetes bacterium]